MANHKSAPSPNPITSETFEERILPWMNIIKKGESASIIFCPEADTNTRLNHFLESTDLQKKYLHDLSKYIFLLIDIDLLTKEGYSDATALVSKLLNEKKSKKLTFEEWMIKLKKNGQRVVFMITNTNKIVDSNIEQILTIVENNKSVSALLFFEINITCPETLKVLPKRSIILQNVLYCPLYLKKDTDQYIRYLAWKWEMTIPDKIFNVISAECHGHTLLIKEAVRYFSRNPQTNLDSLFNHEEMNMRLEWIHALFSQAEQQVLKKISLGNRNFDDKEKQILEHLRKLQLLNSANEITIPLLEKYIQNRKHINIELKLEAEEIILNNVPIKHMFSKKESHVLKNLLKRPGELISRDDIAKFIWPINTEDNYSDWAIDQIMKRLRTKLAQLFIPEDVIQTYRGKGYKFNISKYA